MSAVSPISAPISLTPFDKGSSVVHHIKRSLIQSDDDLDNALKHRKTGCIKWCLVTGTTGHSQVPLKLKGKCTKPKYGLL